MNLLFDRLRGSLYSKTALLNFALVICATGTDSVPYMKSMDDHKKMLMFALFGVGGYFLRFITTEDLQHKGKEPGV